MGCLISCCKDCADRHVNCHANCERYEAQKRNLENAKKWLRKENWVSTVHKNAFDKHVKNIIENPSVRKRRAKNG